MHFRSVCLLQLTAIVLFCGCGDSGRDSSRAALVSMSGGELKETAAISGKVSLDGQPAGRVTIYAYSVATPAKKPDFECLTKDDGTYCWQTYTECDGLPIGEYQLAFKKTGPRQKPGAEDAWVESIWIQSRLGFFSRLNPENLRSM